MNHALYVGTIGHRRHIPRAHGFRYPFFMWYFNLDRLDGLPDLRPWFSGAGFSWNRFHRPDYLGPADQPLAHRVRQRMAELTGRPVAGEVSALLNLRTLGLYFSPVNFYFGFDSQGRCSHLLAEVSNIPWNERHHYAFWLGDGQRRFSHPKVFKVSPFNPVDQRYRWRIAAPGASVGIEIKVDDRRGHLFSARLQLVRQDLTAASVRRLMRRHPVATALIVGRIYWQALRLFLKGVPYIPYHKEVP